MDLDIPLPEECVPPPPGISPDIETFEDLRKDMKAMSGDDDDSLDTDDLWANHKDDETIDSNDVLSNDNSLDVEDSLGQHDSSVLSFDDSRYSPSRMSEDSEESVPYSPTIENYGNDTDDQLTSEIGLPPIDTSGARPLPPTPARKLPQIHHAILRKANPKPKPPAKIMKGSKVPVLGKEQAKKRLLAFSASKQAAAINDKLVIESLKAKGSSEELETSEPKPEPKLEVKLEPKSDSKQNVIKVAFKDSDSMRNIAEIMQEELKLKAQLERQRVEREARQEALRAELHRGGRYDRYRDDWDRRSGSHTRGDRRYHGSRKRPYDDEEYKFKKSMEASHEKRVHKIMEIPNSWKDFKSKSVQYEDIRRIKRKIREFKSVESKPQEEGSRSKSRGKKERRRSNSREKDNPRRSESKEKESEGFMNPFIAKGIWGREKEFPRHLIKFTKQKPHVSYCANPLRAAGYYKSRKDMLAACDPESRSIMEELISSCSSAGAEISEKRRSRNKGLSCDEAIGLIALQNSYNAEDEASDHDDDSCKGFWYLKNPSDLVKEEVHSNGDIIKCNSDETPVMVSASKPLENLQFKSKWDSDEDAEMAARGAKVKGALEGYEDGQGVDKSGAGSKIDVAEVKLDLPYDENDGIKEVLAENEIKSITGSSASDKLDLEDGLYDELDGMMNNKKSESLNDEYEEFIKAVSRDSFSKGSADLAPLLEFNKSNELSEDKEKSFKFCSPQKVNSRNSIEEKEEESDDSSSANGTKSPSSDSSADSSESTSSSQIAEKKKKHSKKLKKSSKKSKKKLKRKQESDSDSEKPKKKLKTADSSKSSDSSADEVDSKKVSKHGKKVKHSEKTDSESDNSGDVSKKRKKKKKSHEKKKKHGSKLKIKKKKKKQKTSKAPKKHTKNSDDENEDGNPGGSNISGSNETSEMGKTQQEKTHKKCKKSHSSKSDSSSMSKGVSSKFTLHFNLDEQEEAIKKIIAGSDENIEEDKEQIKRSVEAAGVPVEDFSVLNEALYSPEDLLESDTVKEIDSANKSLEDFELANLISLRAAENTAEAGEQSFDYGMLASVPKAGIPVVLPPDEPVPTPPSKIVAPTISDTNEKVSHLNIYSDDFGFSGPSLEDDSGATCIPGTESPIPVELIKAFWEGGTLASESQQAEPSIIGDILSEVPKEPPSRIIHGPNPTDVIDMNEVMKELRRRATMMGLTKFQGFSASQNCHSASEEGAVPIEKLGEDNAQSNSEDQSSMKGDSYKQYKDRDKDKRSAKLDGSTPEDKKKSSKSGVASSRSDDESDDKHKRSRRDRDPDRNDKSYRSSDRKSKYRSSHHSDSSRSRRSPSPRHYDSYDRYSSSSRHRSDRRSRNQPSKKKSSRRSRSRSSSPKYHRTRSPTTSKREDSK